MDISGSELPNNVGGNGVEGNGQKKFVGRHDVQRSSGAKPPKSPESTKKRQKTKTLAKEREVVSLDEVFKKEEFNGRAYGVGFRGKSIRFVDKKSADACREFAMNKLKGRPKIATQERQLHHSDRSVIAFSQATQDDLEKNVFLYMIDKNGEMVPLSQDQKESLKLQYQAMQAFQDNVQTQTNDVMPQQDPIANDEQNIQNQPMQPQNLVANDWQQVQQQQENIQKQEGKVMSSLNQQPGDVVQFDEQRQTNAGAMAIGAQSRQAVVHGNVSRADQLCQFIDQSVQCIQNMNVQNMKSPNDTAELWQCLHMMFGYVQLIYASCSELETVDNDRALQINDALLEVLGFFSSGNQQVQQLQAALRQQGPTLQNMQSVLNLLTVAQNQGISASQMQGMLTYAPNGGSASQMQEDIQPFDAQNQFLTGIVGQIGEIINRMREIRQQGGDLSRMQGCLYEMQDKVSILNKALESMNGGDRRLQVKVMHELGLAMQNVQNIVYKDKVVNANELQLTVARLKFGGILTMTDIDNILGRVDESLKDAQCQVGLQIIKEQLGQNIANMQQIEQEFNVLLQQGITSQGLQYLSNRMQGIDQRGQEIEQAINALSQLPNAQQDQINALRGQLGNIAQRYQVLISLGRYLNNPQLLHQELDAIEQGFNKLLQQGIKDDGLLVLANKLQVLSDRLQALGAQGQEIEQAINVLSQLPNATQDQINVLRGQLGSTAQRYQKLIQLQGYLQRIQGLRNKLHDVPNELRKLQKRFSETLGDPLFQNQKVNRLWLEFNDMCERFGEICNEEMAISEKVEGVNPQNGISNDQRNDLAILLKNTSKVREHVQNRLIDVALDAIEWQIAPLFKEEGMFAPVSNWRSGFNGVQNEIDHLRKKLNSGQAVTHEELQNLFNDLFQFLQDPEQRSKLAALVATIAGAVSATGFGALATGASSGGSVSGAITGTIVGMSATVPVACCMACLASLCVTIGGAMHMYSRS